MNLADALSRISALVADGAESRRTAGDGLPVTALLAEARRRRRRFAAVTTVATAAAVALVAAGGASAMSHLGRGPLPPVATTPAPTPTTPPAPTGSPSPSPSALPWPTAPTVAAVPTCGEPVPDVDAPPDPGLRLGVTAPTDGVIPGDARIELRPTFVGAAATTTYADVAPTDIWYVLTQGGVVVSATTGWSDPPDTVSGLLTDLALPADHVLFQACDVGPVPTVDELVLGPGDYELRTYATLRPATVGGVTYGQGSLLLAADPVPLRLGARVTVPDLAPDLPACGASAAGLVASPAVPLATAVSVTGDASAASITASVTNAVVDWFDRLGWGREISWVAVRGGVVVATGATQLPDEATTADLWLGPGASVQLVATGPMTDCRSGTPLTAPVEVWAQVRMLVDLAPMYDSTDPWISLTSGPVPFDPAP